MRGPLTLASAEEFFAKIYRGKHRIPSHIECRGGGSYSVQHHGYASTFDDDTLTRMVVFAHDFGVRLWISQGGPGGFRVTIHRREEPFPTGGMSHSHPTMEQSISVVRTGERWNEVIRRLSVDGGQ